MYSRSFALWLSLSTLTIGFLVGLALTSIRERAARDASWTAGYIRGKAVGKVAQRQTSEIHE